MTNIDLENNERINHSDKTAKTLVLIKAYTIKVRAIGVPLLGIISTNFQFELLVFVCLNLKKGML